MFHQPLVNDIEPGDCSHVVTTKTSNRHSTGGFPSALQDSPYLSSPIRPIPSFRSDSTRKSKRSISCNSRASSPRSTLGSLRLASPYSQSIYSLQSLSSTVSKSAFQDGKKTLNRSVLLPHEIDDIAKFLGATIAMKTEKESGDDDDENEYDLSDFDDDSTVNSDSARSIDDGAVFEHIANNKNDDINLGVHRISTLSTTLTEDETVSFNKRVESNKCQHVEEPSDTTQIKLPSVGTERGSAHAKPTRKKRGKNGASSNKSTSSLLKSPYAKQINPKKKVPSSSNKSDMIFGTR
jgi:hypothetical protein